MSALDDHEVAVAAALAGSEAVRHRYGGPLQRSMKSSTDFATEADVEAEAAIRAVVAEHRPDDAFLGEENGLVGDAGKDFPVGVLAPNGQGIWSLPADVAARYRAIDVTLEPADGNPSRSGRTVLRGAYA